MKNYSFDTIIKEKAAGHEAPVPADAWDNIRKQKKKRPVIAWRVLALLLIGLGLFGVYQFQYRQTGKSFTPQAGKETNAVPTKTNDDVLHPGKNNWATGTQEQESGDNHAETLEQSASTGKNSTAVATGTTPEGYNNETGTVATGPGKHKEVVKGNKPGKNNHGNKALSNDPVAEKPVNNTAITINRIGKKAGTKNKPVKTSVPVIAAAEENETDNTTTANTGKNKKQVKPAGKTRGRITTAEAVSDGTENKAVNDDALATGTVKGKRFRGRTTATITAPEAAEDKETVVAETVTAGNNINKVESPDKKKDSLPADTKLLVNKPAITDTSINPVKVQKAKRIKKLYVDISTMPFVAIQNNASLPAITRTTVNNTSRSEFTADEISTVVNPSFTYTIALRKRVAANWYAGIGVQYTQVKETVTLTGREKNTRFNVIKRLDNSGLFLVDDTVATVTNGIRVIHATNSYRFISIPVFAQYHVWQKKNWLLSLNGGLVFNISNLYKNSIEGELVPQYSAAGLASKKENKITTDVFMSLRLSTLIGKRYRLFAEPTMQFNLQQYRMPNMVNYKHIHKAGLNVGIAWEIKY